MTDEHLKAIIMANQETLIHIGVLRKSGRYPWGSGKTPMQRNKDFLSYVDSMRAKGLTDKDIVDGLNLNSREQGHINAKGDELTTTQYRAAKAIANNMVQAEKEAQAVRLRDDAKMSNVAIGKEMGINESSVRSLLDPATRERRAQLMGTADMLKRHLEEKDQFLDIGVGTENHLGISNDKLAKSVAILQEEGYEVKYIKVPQLGLPGQYTTTKVLAPPGTHSKDIYADISKIGSIAEHTDDGGRSYLGLRPIENMSAKRIKVRYAEDGGTDMDGVMEIRRGVKDLDMGESKYAQVRIGVEGTHYLKGMAMYADDLPPGVDIRFNTNKTKDTPMLGPKDNSVLKLQKKGPDGKVDNDNPFGATIKPGGQKGALNIVNEEGDWSEWSRSLSSQVLSKQAPALAKEQLEMTYKIKKEQLNEIESLTNPTVKKKLLASYADDLDSSSVHLKAAALPRQGTHVILPLTSMKETEIYAPKYENGEKVVLVRYPHGGKFEIPELTVNNKNPQAKSLIQNARDAVGIHPKVAERLSGADFDGDTVLVIPNNNRKVSSAPPLKGLEGFEPKIQYKGFEGMKPMTSRGTQLEMGKISNLITDMTIKGASNAELERAVKHSMVVIDAEKHVLNYRQSAIDNAIMELKTKYQEPSKGASTLISRASSEARVADRRERRASEGGSIDPVTGQKIYVKKDNDYVDANGKTVTRMIKSTKMAETSDAHTLSSGRPIEVIYADHANRLKGLANEARKSQLTTKDTEYKPAAKVAHKDSVDSLDHKLNIALLNAPLERKAQVIANATVAMKRQANPHLDDADLKKISFQALAEARNRVNAGKTLIDITPTEWNAIQAGAISANKLEKILNNADIDQVKKLATPRLATVMTPAKVALAKSLLAKGYTQAEAAAHLGIPASTIDSALS